MRLDLRVYVITDPGAGDHEDLARAALAGGATVVQLRDKRATSRRLYEVAVRLQHLVAEAGVPLIVNDRVDVALAAGAAGVHLGPDDLPVGSARRILGSSGIVGASAGTVAEAVEAERAGADYIGAGPVFATATKPDAGVPIGLEGLRRIAAAVRVPVVGIGGITAENAGSVIAAGASGVAVISAVVATEDKVGAARAIRQAVDATLAQRGAEVR
ncbi:MAG: thiamine phosphate synthase [Armatimonadota bacterium]|nr:thiamine phosphate synthase [Armatimonadota bacterium]